MEVLRQREQLDLMGLEIDARDRVIAAFGEPSGAVAADNDPMRSRAGAKRNLFKLPAGWIEAAGETFLLAADPDAAVRGRCDIVRIAARELVVAHRRGLRYPGGKDQCGGRKNQSADHVLYLRLANAAVLPAL